MEAACKRVLLIMSACERAETQLRQQQEGTRMTAERYTGSWWWRDAKR